MSLVVKISNMEIKNLLSKYQEMKLVPMDTLFEVDLWRAKEQKKCPKCGCKLYEMRNKPFFYCKSKRNGHSFIIKKSKMK